ncbi:hypothetical protein F5J12DRAFT_785757 [Pisolithus orientalis]|uniref:uncharacterized protein n=1 Tax=Pisolithus orientalis TaxID=936130 RepID=UPI002224202E|nr:uncharacterized protein F5J12DRAFT_785757 [Pisolithus orientalis]KAI5994562.1 hypothetical protein F5J12DRAFT_785757 [Pisolithus orientalis]
MTIREQLWDKKWKGPKGMKLQLATKEQKMAKLASCIFHAEMDFTPAMAKDCEANDTAARLANVKRKVAKMEYVSTSEVEGGGINDKYGNVDNAICVLGHKNVMTE